MNNIGKHSEAANGNSVSDVAVATRAGISELIKAGGHYDVVCRDKDGNIKWEDKVENLVTTLGANLLLDTLLAGSAYSVTGPYMGLINTNASAAAIADTMASHAGWLEVGATNDPHYTSPRKTISFSAAAAKAKASTGTYTFAITSAGTVGGCFLVLNTGAVSTIDNTSGTLYSAGAFTGGSKVVANLDSLTVTYTASA
jgi:hypothetical protein